jgi:hypothetical protein
MYPIIQLRVDERMFHQRSEATGTNLLIGWGQSKVLITVQESEWFPRGAIEHLHVFVHSHQAAISAALGYILKTAVDAFKGWAVERLKRAPGNTEVLTIFGADGKPVRKISVRTDYIEEE